MPMRRAQPIYRAIACVAVLLLGTTRLMVADGQQGDGESSVATVLEELRAAVHELHENYRAQNEAWPTRLVDQASEHGAPPAVLALQKTQQELTERIEALSERLKNTQPPALDNVLRSLESSRDLEFVTAVLPTATASQDERVDALLSHLAQSWAPCPRSIVDALVARENDSADDALFAIGRMRREPALIAAAGASGNPRVVAKIIDLCESSDRDTAALGRRALERLDTSGLRGWKAHGRPACVPLSSCSSA